MSYAILAGIVGATAVGITAFVLLAEYDVEQERVFIARNITGTVQVGAILPLSGPAESRPEENRTLYYRESFGAGAGSRNPPQPGALTPLGSATSRSEEALAAVQLAEDDFNRHLREAWAGWTLDVRVEDTAGDPVTALQKVTGLHEDGIDIVIGPHFDAELLHIKDYVDDNGMLVISHASTFPALAIPDDAVFRLVPSDGQNAKALAKVLRSYSPNVWVTIWRGDAWGDGMAEAVKREFEAIGGTMDNAVRYDPDTTDFTEHASLLAERVKYHLQAARVEYAGGGTGGIHTVAAMHRSQYFPVESVGVLAVTHQEIREIGRAAAEHGVFEHVKWVGGDAELDGTGLLSEHCVLVEPVCWRDVSGASLLPSDPVNRKFFDFPNISAMHFNLPIGAAGERVIDTMSEKFGHRPDESVLAIYDAVWIAGLSILAADSTDARFVLQEVRGAAGEHDAALGTIRLDEAGDLVADHHGIWTMTTWSWHEGSRYIDGRVVSPLILE